MTQLSCKSAGKQRFAGFATAALSAFALCASNGAQAVDIHNPMAPYSISISDTSTAFNGVHWFNGLETDLTGFGRYQTEWGAPTYYDHLSVTFVADPGYVFTSMNMSFYPFYWQNNSYLGGHWFQALWSVSPGTGETAAYRYANLGGPFDANLDCPDPRCYAFDQTGTSGVVKKSDYYWGSGGGSTFQGLPIMSAAGISFANASSFTILMDITGQSAGVFGMDLDINANMISAPAIAPVPEPETYAMLLAGLGMLGFAARRRKLNVATRC